MKFGTDSYAISGTFSALALDCAASGAAVQGTTGTKRTKTRFMLASEKSKREPDLYLVMSELGNRNRLNQGTIIYHTLLPMREPPCLIVPFDIPPIGLDEVAIPLVEPGH